LEEEFPILKRGPEKGVGVLLIVKACSPSVVRRIVSYFIE
jgi:hypothetical protein